MSEFKVGDQVKLVGHGTRDNAMRIKAIDGDQVQCEWDAYEVTQAPGSRFNTYRFTFPASLLRLVPPSPGPKLPPDIRQQMEAIMAGVPPVPVPNSNQELAEAALKDLPLGYIATAEPIVIGIGDVVRLKSGGPLMTVIFWGITSKIVKCKWFERITTELREHEFPMDTLKRVDLGSVQPCTKWRDEVAPVPPTGNPGGDAVG